MQSQLPYDEPDLDDSDQIIRRISLKYHFTRDKNTGELRLSSKAFSASKDSGMSVDIKKLIEDAELDPRVFVTNPDYVCSVTLTAGSVREIDLRIGYEPTSDNPYHGEVWGPQGGRSDKFTKAQQRYLRDAAEWFVEPDELD